MCTSITLKNGDIYFGRNLDLEYSFGERVVITPRNYIFKFRKCETQGKRLYAMAGMATVSDNYPLYAEAVNEKGLYMAGLNFPGNACYNDGILPEKDNITPFELIPWVLGQAEDIKEARGLLERINIINIPFKESMPLAPLHWHIADKNSALVLERTREGMKIFEDPVGVLTNNPPFDFHLMNLNQYMHLTPGQPANGFSDKIKLKAFGEGMGAVGLPGDSSPASRFVKASFLKLNAVSCESEESRVSEFFHILDAVGMVRGSVVTESGRNDITTYSCCINGDKGIYYYKTYENSRVTAIDMFGRNADGCSLVEFPLRDKADFYLESFPG